MRLSLSVSLIGSIPSVSAHAEPAPLEAQGELLGIDRALHPLCKGTDEKVFHLFTFSLFFGIIILKKRRSVAKRRKGLVERVSNTCCRR